MPLIKGHGQRWALADNLYTTLKDGGAISDGGPIAVSLARYNTERETLLARNAPVAVILSSDQSPEALAPDLDRIGAVFLEFPKFRDGRGYSWARMLRQRFGYRGEIRAIGDVLRDQWLFMSRCGVDAFELRPVATLGEFQAAMTEQTVFYQPAVDQRGTIGRAPAKQIALSAAAE